MLASGVVIPGRAAVHFRQHERTPPDSVGHGERVEHELDCGDGRDNDNNEGIDCADPDCSVDRDGDGFSPCNGDCDDDDPEVFPGAEDPCNGVDNDCDGEIPAPEECDPHIGESVSIATACNCAGACSSWRYVMVRDSRSFC